MTVEQHLTPECRCLNCGERLGEAMGFGKPQPGDATLCLQCGHFMIFKQDLRLRNPTGKELEQWAGNKDLVAASSIVDQFKRERS